MEGAGNMLATLLARGDRIAVVRGRLVISPASGKPVPDDWLKEWAEPLVIAAARLAGLPALSYQGHDVGNYQVGNGSGTRKGGLALQFRCLTTGQELYAIFNVDTKRARDTKAGKKGDPLPPGQFRAGKKSGFYHFWQCTDLPFQRLANLHQRMGNLRELVYTADLSTGERIASATLRPLEIPNLAINSQTSRNQIANNMQTRVANKETQQRQQPRGIQPNPTTGEPNHGNKVIREHGYKGKGKSPQDQSSDEWLTDYTADDAGGLHDR